MAFGVYVHFPYCRKRCPYCDFAVSAAANIPHEAYLSAVLLELARQAPLFENRRLVSIYLGGGTPSLWRSDCIETLIAKILQMFPPQPESIPEITLEMDPLDALEATANTWASFQRAGIHRFSMGIQSLQNAQLRQLGRLHSAEQAQQAVERVRERTGGLVSLDIMIGLPEQTQETLEQDLTAFVSLQPDHISIYQLTIEPNTAFSAAVRKKQWAPLDHTNQAKLYEAMQTTMRHAGFLQYEISSFARQDPHRDLRAVHNRLYWTGGEYLGLGVSAHSFRRCPDGGGERWSNTRSPAIYLRQAAPRSVLQVPIADGTSLYEKRSADEIAREAMWLGLRQPTGISTEMFEKQYGVHPIHAYPKELAELVQKGWVSVTNDRIKPTQQGILFSDEVGLAFL